MRYCVGIDLGSTTTKAVVLDEDGGVLGRGITNSRSNYEVACDVALVEALTDARFGLLARELEREGVGAERRAALLAGLERGFREQQYRAQLDELETALGAALGESAERAGLEDAVQRILGRMREETPELYAPGATRKSDFFRDLAGSRYMHFAEGEARRHELSFDALAGTFDKAILVVENSPQPGASARWRSPRRTGWRRRAS